VCVCVCVCVCVHIYIYVHGNEGKEPVEAVKVMAALWVRELNLFIATPVHSSVTPLQ
jgi:hypothetical protein